jgi:hypothetical protein
MPILSSRPTTPAAQLSNDDVVRAAQPTINILYLLSDLVKLPDDSMMSLMRSRSLMQDALDAMVLEDYSIVPLPGTARIVLFEVSIQPLKDPSIVTFRVAFDVV